MTHNSLGEPRDLPPTRTWAAHLVAFVFWCVALAITAWPLLLLRENHERLRENRVNEASRRWLDQSATHIERVRQAARPEYWVAAAGRRLQKTYNIHTTDIHLALSLRRALQQAPGVNGHAARLWLVRQRRDAATGEVTAVRAPGLASEQGQFITSLLGELTAEVGNAAERERGGSLASPETAFRADNTRTTPPTTAVRSGATWLHRVRLLFGPGMSPEVFRLAGRGRAFQAINDRRHGYLLWDVTGPAHAPTGAFLLWVPGSEAPEEQAMRTCLERWQGRAWFPVYIRFPELDSNPRWREWAPPAGAALPLSQWLAPVRDQIAAGGQWPRLWAPPLLRLPTPLLGRAIRLDEAGHWWGRVFSLPATAHGVGILVGRAPQATLSRDEIVAWWVGLGWLFGWVMVTASLLIHGRLPSVGIRATLLLWFLGVTAIPLSISIGASSRLDADLQQNRTDAAHEQLNQVLFNIENGFQQHADLYAKACRAVCRGAGLGSLAGQRSPDAAELVARRRTLEPMARAAWHDLVKAGIRVTSLQVFGAAGMEAEYRDPLVPADLLTAARYMSLERWKSLQPDEVRQPQRVADKEDASALAIVRFSTQNASANRDELNNFSAGNRMWTMFRTPIGNAETTLGRQAFFFWDRAPLVDDYLNRELGRTNAGRVAAGIAVVAFRPTNDQLRRIGPPPSDHQTPWAAVARDAQRGPVSRHLPDRQMLVQGRACPRLGGVVLVGRIALDPVVTALARDKQYRVLQWCGWLACTVAAAFLLSAWIGAPLERMTRGLHAVAGGNLAVSVAEPRGDELEEAGRTLDRMIAWLRERREMSRFVAPQVLDVVAAGDYRAAMAGQRRDVVVLSSDIRSFTTLSETHPPAAIFAMLNDHMEAMTAAIQAENGAIDRFIGDAIVAVFYRHGDTDPAVRALRAAVAMRAAHWRLAARRAAANQFPYEMGIGLESGSVVAGVVGDPESRLDFTVLGDVTMHAGDLEALSKHGTSSRIVVSTAIRNCFREDAPFARLPVGAEAWEWQGGLDGPDVDDATRTGATRAGATRTGLPTPEPDDRLPDTEVAGPQNGAPPSAEIELRPTTMATTWRWLHSAASWVLFGLLPVLLVWSIAHFYTDSRRTAAAQLAENRINELFRRIGDHPDAETQTTLYCNRLIAQSFPASRLTTPAAARAATRRFDHRMTRVAAALPGLRWQTVWYGPLLASATVPERPEIISEIIGSGSEVIAPGSTLRVGAQDARVYTGLQRLMLHFRPIAMDGINFRGFNQELWKWWTTAGECRLFGRTVGLLGASRHLLRSLGRLNEFELYGTSMLWLWQPIRALRVDADGRRRLVAVGAVTMCLPPAALSEAVAWRMFAANLAGDGLACAVWPPTKPDRPVLATRAFRRDGELQALARIPQREPLAGTTWIKAERIVGDTRPMRIAIAAGLPADTTLPRPVRALLGAAAVIWLGLTSLLSFWRRAAQLSVRRSLRLQLAGTFAVVVSLSLTMGLGLFERAGIESREQAVADGFRRLGAELAALDEAQTMFYGLQLTLLDRKFRDVDLGTWLTQWEDASRGLASAPQPANALAFVIHEMHRLGLPVRRIRALAPAGFVLATGNTSKNERAFSWLLCGDSPDPAITPAGPARPTPLNSVLLAQIDSIRKVMESTLASDELAAFLNGTRLYGSMRHEAGQNDTTVYLRRMSRRGAPHWVVLTDLDIDHPRLLSLALRHDWLASDAAAPSRISFERRNVPGWQPAPPFTTTAIRTIDAPAAQNPLRQTVETSMRQWGRPRAGTLAGLVLQAEAINAPVRHYPRHDHDRLALAWPSQTLITHILSADVDRQQVGLPQTRAARRERFTLGLLAVASLFFAVWAANRFLRPVRNLTRQARRIMAGDFTATLPVESDDEFGRLARAFNEMARGVREGQLLRRFVSESVTTVAGSSGAEAAGRAAATSATVLFAGLAQFKSLARDLPAEQLITLLNRSLGIMARAVRDQGGEIDKFIGDKILGVFHPNRLGGTTAAAAAAITAAQTMRRAIAADPVLARYHVGIGVASGPLLVGVLGAAAVRLEHTVIGDTVNLASRLADVGLKETGGAIITETGTAQLLGGGTELQNRGAIAVKGKREPVPVFALAP